MKIWITFLAFFTSFGFASEWTDVQVPNAKYQLAFKKGSTSSFYSLNPISITLTVTRNSRVKLKQLDNVCDFKLAPETALETFDNLLPLFDWNKKYTCETSQNTTILIGKAYGSGWVYKAVISTLKGSNGWVVSYVVDDSQENSIPMELVAVKDLNLKIKG